MSLESNFECNTVKVNEEGWGRKRERQRQADRERRGNRTNNSKFHVLASVRFFGGIMLLKSI